MIDLNVPWTGANDIATWVENAQRKGWTALASNVYCHCDRAGVRDIAMEPQCEPGASKAVNISTTLGKYAPTGATFVRRTTVVLHEGFQPNSFAKIADGREYDVVAVMPTTQKTFQVACENLNCDLINLDYYCHYAPFKVRRGMVMMALHRGCFFEVTMSALDHVLANDRVDANKVNHAVAKTFRSHLAAVLNYIPLRRLVLSPGNASITSIVDPETFVGMCNELLSCATGGGGAGDDDLCDARDCVTVAPRGCIAKGAARRTYGTGILVHKPGEPLGSKFATVMPV